MATILFLLKKQWEQYCLRKRIVNTLNLVTFVVIILAGGIILWPTEFHWFIFLCQAIGLALLSIEWGRVHQTQERCLETLYRQDPQLAEAIHIMLDFQATPASSSGTAYFQAKHLDSLNNYLSKKALIKKGAFSFSILGVHGAIILLGIVIWFLPQLPTGPLAQFNTPSTQSNDPRTYRIWFPAYTQKTKLVYKQLPNIIQLPEGSRLDISINQNSISEKIRLGTFYEINKEQKKLKWLLQKEKWVTSYSPLSSGILYQKWKNSSSRHEIEVIKDFPPQVAVTWPQDKKIFSNSTLSIILVASDDYGLRNVSLVYEVAGKGRAHEIIQSFEGRFSEHTETYPWELGVTFLRHSDRVVAWIEVGDNDTINGPKITKSEKFEFTINSIQSYHQDITSRVQNIVGEMGKLLALLDRRLLSESLNKEQEILKELDLLQKDGKHDQLLNKELSDFLHKELREKILYYQTQRLDLIARPS